MQPFVTVSQKVKSVGEYTCILAGCKNDMDAEKIFFSIYTAYMQQISRGLSKVVFLRVTEDTIMDSEIHRLSQIPFCYKCPIFPQTSMNCTSSSCQLRIRVH